MDRIGWRTPGLNEADRGCAGAVRLARPVPAHGRSQWVVELPRTRQAPDVARRWFAESLASELDSLAQQTATLLVSELVTNAVVHGRGRIELHAELDRNRLLVEVIDEGPGFVPAVRGREPDIVGGYGLRIVAEEASRWGIREGASAVWFEIPRHESGTNPRLRGPVQDPRWPQQGPEGFRSRRIRPLSRWALASTLPDHGDARSRRHRVGSSTESSVPSVSSPTRHAPSGPSSRDRRGRAELAAFYRRVADTLERSADLVEQHAEREHRRGGQRSVHVSGLSAPDEHARLRDAAAPFARGRRNTRTAFSPALVFFQARLPLAVDFDL